jgi:hypothetical protein
MHVHLHAKNLVECVTQQKIADASQTRHKLIPVRIRGVPVYIRGLGQKKLHMGRPITHKEVVHIWGVTCIYLDLGPI